MRALSKQPQDRFESCGELLTAIKGGASSPSEPLQPVSARPEVSPHLKSTQPFTHQSESNVLRQKLLFAHKLKAIPEADRADAEYSKFIAVAEDEMAVAEEACRLGLLNAATESLGRVEAAMDGLHKAKADRAESERKAREEAERKAKEESERKAWEEAEKNTCNGQFAYGRDGEVIIADSTNATRSLIWALCALGLYYLFRDIGTDDDHIEIAAYILWSILGSLGAIIYGVKALRDIRKIPKAKGKVRALLGIMLGATCIIFSLVALVAASRHSPPLLES